MNGITIILVSAVVLIIGYLGYGRWLANQWGVDKNALTPAVRMEDGKNFSPASRFTVFAHQFSSICGADIFFRPCSAASSDGAAIFYPRTASGASFFRRCSQASLRTSTPRFLRAPSGPRRRRFSLRQRFLSFPEARSTTAWTRLFGTTSRRPAPTAGPRFSTRSASPPAWRSRGRCATSRGSSRGSGAHGDRPSQFTRHQESHAAGYCSHAIQSRMRSRLSGGVTFSRLDSRGTMYVDSPAARGL